MEKRDRNELARWLQTATRGLSGEVRDRVRAEIEAHYHDAVADHLAAGKGADEAHRAALADLGEPRGTARALRETHLSITRYVIAMLLSLMYPFTTFGLSMLVYSRTGSEAVGTIVLNLDFIPVLYILQTFRRLMRERFSAEPVERGMSLFLWGMAISSGAQIALALGYPDQLYELYVSNLWKPTSAVRAALDWATVLGWATLATGMLAMARGLLKQDERLYGLRRALAYTLGLDGASGVLLVLILVLASDLGKAETALTLVSLVAFLMHTIIMALLTLLFFRVVYRGRRDPLQVA